MIDAGPSLRAAEPLNLDLFVGYLAAKGWTSRPARVSGINIFTLLPTGLGKPVTFILPTDPGEPDEVWRKADALRTIAAVEGRAVLDVAGDIQRYDHFATTPAVAGGFAEEGG